MTTTLDKAPRTSDALEQRVGELERELARYQKLFEHAPISLWEEDWSEVKRYIDDLRRGGVEDLKAHFEAQPGSLERCVALIRVLSVNHTTVTMYRARSKEQLLAGISALFNERTLVAFESEVLALAGGATAYEGQTFLRTLDGQEKHFFIKLLIPEGHEQSWELVFVAFLDLTEHDEAEATRQRSRLQEQVIEAQRAALGALSTPVIPISDKVIVMPLVGMLDEQRMEQVTTTLLREVERRRASTAIIDITGVTAVDAVVANMLLSAARAVRLLGAQVMLTGIRPEVAELLVGLGVNLEGIMTHGTLQAGIAHTARRPT